MESCLNLEIWEFVTYIVMAGEVNLCLFQQSTLPKIFDRHELVRQEVTQVIFLLFPFPVIHLLHLIVESFLAWDIWVFQVICSVCDTEQPVRVVFWPEFMLLSLVGITGIDDTMSFSISIQVARICTNCGVNMGEYFCQVCKFYDDDVVYCAFS